MNTEASANLKARITLLDWFARHPIVGLVGTIASILSLVLFFLSQKDRDIRYATSASPTTIVRNGQSSDLKVYFANKELTSDVSSIQIAIWNAGKETVRRENILSKTIALKFNPPTTILEARVKTVTRNLVNFQINSSDSSSGILYCSWDILEHGDGALLEVFFVGTSGDVLSAGAIEGQLPIRRVIHDPNVGPIPNWGLMAILGIAILTGVVFSVTTYPINKSMKTAVLNGFGSSIVTFLMLFMLASVVATLIKPSVPFAF